MRSFGSGHFSLASPRAEEMVRYIAVNKPFARAGIAVGSGLLMGAVACGPPKPEVPALTPGNAAALLQLNPKSKNWLTRVQKDDATCEYKVELPDQSAHPTTIDVERIITCGGKPAPRSLDATVTYKYDAAEGHWIIGRFSS